MSKRNIQEKREIRNFYLFISPWIFGFLCFTLFPVLWSLYLSFTQYNGVAAPKFIGLDNYIGFINDDLFHAAVRSTLLYTVMSVPIVIIFSLGLAMLLNRKMPFKGFFRTTMFMPSMVSGVTMAILWSWLFNPSVGLVRFVLSIFGIKSPMFMTDKNWVIPGLVIMTFWTVGVGMVIFLAALKSVPDTYYEAAKIDGARPIYVFFKITLPLISPVLLFQLIMGIIDSFQVFTQAYVITQGGPNYSTWFYVYYIYRSAFEYKKMGYSAALGWLLLIVVSAISFYVMRSSAKHVYYEGGQN
ncbi:MAG: sugar ABC transporter permease [Oscillospiraceae bacterium]|nr:sugar ABC transporter permease [Oscillospiraceae bacterium]